MAPKHHKYILTTTFEWEIFLSIIILKKDNWEDTKRVRPWLNYIKEWREIKLYTNYINSIDRVGQVNKVRRPRSTLRKRDLSLEASLLSGLRPYQVDNGGTWLSSNFSLLSTLPRIFSSKKNGGKSTVNYFTMNWKMGCTLKPCALELIQCLYFVVFTLVVFWNE